MEFNKSKNWPAIFVIDMRPIPILVLSIFPPESVSVILFWFGFWLLVVFSVARTFNVTVTTIMRKLRKVFIGKKLLAYPVAKHVGLKK